MERSCVAPVKVVSTICIVLMVFGYHVQLKHIGLADILVQQDGNALEFPEEVSTTSKGCGVE